MLSRKRQEGFTLMELIVAAAIAAFIVFATYKIFNEVAGAVHQGTSIGEILQRARAVDEQLTLETKTTITGGKWGSRMVGPGGNRGGGVDYGTGGLLVIVQHVIQAPVTEADRETGKTHNIRSDQLMFIYDNESSIQNFNGGAHPLTPMAPANEDSFGGNMLNSTASSAIAGSGSSYVRIWYGHVLQIRPDGSSPTTDDLGNLSDLANPNVLASQWVLGRQALFLHNADTSAAIKTDTPAGIHAERSAATNSGTGPMAQVTGYVTGVLGQGLTDVAAVPLENLTGPLVLQNGYPPYLTATNATDYQDRVLGLGNYAPMLFDKSRLYTASPYQTSLMAQVIAPMHTYFIGGVSDFIVEFAGDLHANTGTFAGGSTDPNNKYVPTTSLTATAAYNPDGLLDRDINGDIVWYTSPNLANNNGSNQPADPSRPLTYSVPQTGYTPFVSPTRLTTGGAIYADAAFVWQNRGSNGGPTTGPGNAVTNDWPWLLRIRYRVHAKHGNRQGTRPYVGRRVNGEPEPGQWFETVVPVNRQP